MKSRRHLLMTKEEVEIYEKLIEATALYTTQQARVETEIVNVRNAVLENNRILQLIYKYFRETGSGNFEESIRIAVKEELDKKHKPVSIMLKAIGAVTALLTAIAGILLLVLK